MYTFLRKTVLDTAWSTTSAQMIGPLVHKLLSSSSIFKNWQEIFLTLGFKAHSERLLRPWLFNMHRRLQANMLYFALFWNYPFYVSKMTSNFLYSIWDIESLNEYSTYIINICIQFTVHILNVCRLL